MFTKNKLNIITIVGLMYAVLIGSSCSSKRKIPKLKNMETLDIVDIRSKINAFTKGHEQELVEKGRLEIKSDSLIINIMNASGNYISYFEQNTKKPTAILISGNEKEGFIKTISDNNFYIIKEYYGNGKIKSIKQISYDDGPGIGHNRVEFPIGKYLKYDENGNLMEIIEYDQIFKFSYGDMIKFFADKNYIMGQVRGKAYSDGTGRWEVWYRDTKNQLCKMVLNAKTGQIISDSRGLIFIE